MSEILKTVSKNGKTLSIRKTALSERENILSLQREVVNAIANKEWFVEITADEITESADMDFIIGAYDGARLVAFSLTVLNRDCDRSVGKKYGFDPEKCATFDSVFVHPEYRGFGLQQAFIELAKQKARENGATSLWATVSPYNIYSHRNCEQRGFYCYKCNEYLYGGRLRDVLVLEIRPDFT